MELKRNVKETWEDIGCKVEKDIGRNWEKHLGWNLE